MRVTVGVLIRTLFGWLPLPVFFVGIVPWWLRCALAGPVVWQGSWRQWLGAWLIVNGIGLAGWCSYLFMAEGKGTPSPLDPPKRFVNRGPYRFVRNPLVLGLVLILGGEAFLYQDWRVTGYAFFVGALACLFVYHVEEPQLEQRFGPLYCEYKREVPRWLPRPILRAHPGKRR